uniref:hypothetical protein n=1 Tax=Ophiocordyceps sobolifera TaxID=94213 RepID=UPI0030E2AC54
MDALWYRKPYLCLKLSNSGDVLKFLALNYIWKYISGWSNYSGIVINQEIIEREMDYRGSKSIIANIPLNFHSVIVKEQRVDGNYIGNPMLRCTLMGLERDCRNKILSKSSNRYYSTNFILKDTSQKMIFNSILIL